MQTKVTLSKKVDGRTTRPANSIFASKEAETAAMMQLRNCGNSNRQIAKACGVCLRTVIKRIGCQPAEMTMAQKKLGGAHTRAANNVKKAFAAQFTVNSYNASAAQLNVKLAEVRQLLAELEQQKQAAVEASKAVKMPLVELSKLPATRIS